MYKISITKEALNNLFKKLPISYYLGKKLDVEISPNSKSFFNLENSKIYISPDLLNDIELENKPNEEEIEDLVRCALYHELSHTICTPSNLFDFGKTIIPKVVLNIIEDERIETLLKNYFMRVDFKKFVFKINNHKVGEKPSSLLQAFYYFIRFDEINFPISIDNKLKLNKEKNNLLSNFNFNAININNIIMNKYISKCKYLYDMFSLYYDNSINEIQVNNNEEENNLNLNLNCNSDFKESREKKEDDDLIIINSSKSENIFTNDLKGYSKENAPCNDFIEELKKGIEKLSKKNNLFYDKIYKCIYDYKIRNKLNKGGKPSYNGRLSARLYTLDNHTTYKWFENNKGENFNHGSKLRLNFFCDTSGSFEYNENIINQLISSLLKIENELNDKFEFNVIEMDSSMRILPKENRYIHTNVSGTNIKPYWNNIINSLQSTKYDCINLFVFDGKIYSNLNDLSIFNKDNFYVITDSSNEFGFKKTCKNLKKLISLHDEDYIDSIEKEITNIITNYLISI